MTRKKRKDGEVDGGEKTVKIKMEKEVEMDADLSMVRRLVLLSKKDAAAADAVVGCVQMRIYLAFCLVGHVIFCAS
uniref:Uncharacterized protein n=1 Tax=Syphacia muris TaxID=451379 RepID=A0A0N5A9E9_9BILA